VQVLVLELVVKQVQCSSDLARRIGSAKDNVGPADLWQGSDRL